MPRLISISILAIALLTASAAPAAEAPTRDEYVERLEAICEPDALATQRAMKGFRSDLRAERLGVAASKTTRALRIFESTTDEMAAAPRPPADLEKLRKWYGYLGNQESYLRRIVSQLRAGRLVPAQRLLSRFIHNGNLANNTVLAFGFDWCSFKFSRYG